MRKRMGSTLGIILDEDVLSAVRRGAFAVVSAVGLIFLPTLVFAFPETTSRQVFESNALPPTYMAEQQSVGHSRRWSSGSIFFHPPRNDRASTNRNFEPTFGGHPGADQFDRQSTRQRIQDIRSLLFPEMGRSLRDLQIIDVMVDQDRPGQPERRRGTGGETFLIDSGLGDLVLDIVEPNLEAGGLFVSTIQELGRIPLMFLREVRTFVGGETDSNDSSRRSTGQNLSPRPAAGIQMRTQPQNRQVRGQYSGTNSGPSLMQKLFDGAIVAITHPGFIAFAIFLIGALILGKSRSQNR